LDATDSTNSTFPLDIYTNSSNTIISEPLNAPGHVEENRLSSKVSVKRIKCTKIEKLNETDDIRNERDEHRTTSTTPRSRGASFRVNQKSKLDIINEDPTNNPNFNPPESSSTEAVPRSKTDRVNVKKISRTKTAATQQGLSSNISNSEQSSLEMQPPTHRSKTAANVSAIGTKSNSAVTVTKLSRIPKTAK
jgi:hypothetical protein